MTPKQAYVYRCDVLRMVDGDTADLLIDCGFGMKTTQRIRIRGIDTPEMRGSHRPAGIIATETAAAWVSVAYSEHGAGSFLVETGKEKGVFGRYVGDLYSADGLSLADYLLERELALPITDKRAKWTVEQLQAIVDGSHP